PRLRRVRSLALPSDVHVLCSSSLSDATPAAQTSTFPYTTLFRSLADILGELEVEDEEAVEENLDGTLTHKIDLVGERNQLWIDAETNQIQRIEIEELVPEDADSGPQVRLDLAEADETEIEELYDDLTTVAEDELGASRDARIEVGWESSPTMDCEPGPHCTWSNTVHDAGGDGSGTVHVRMDVTFSNDEIGDQE